MTERSLSSSSPTLTTAVCPQTRGTIRCFRKGSAEPDPELAALVHSLPEPEAAFCAQRHSGPLALAVARARQAVVEWQEGTLPAAGDPEARAEALLAALMDVVPSAQARVRALGRLGRFHFTDADSPAQRRRLLRALVTPQDSAATVRRQAQLLLRLWQARPDSWLDHLLQRPAQAGRALKRQLDRAPLALACHRPHEPPPPARRALIQAGVVAYERDGCLCLLGGVEQALAAAGAGEVAPLSLLLLHETVVARTVAELGEAAARVLAGAVIRCLAGDALTAAVEEFCAEWGSRELAVEPTPTEAATPGTPTGAGLDPERGSGRERDSWTDCIISQDDLRPEAFVPRTWGEQRAILREMFGDDWTEEDERELVAIEAS